MPPLPPIANVLKIEIIGSYTSAGWAQVMHSEYSGGPPSDADLNTAAGDFATFYNENFMPLLSNQLTSDEIRITDLSSDTAAFGEAPAGGAGVHTTPDLPANVALVVSWGIRRRYRGGHPRTYFCGLLTADQVDQRLWTGAATSAWITAASTFKSSWEAYSTGTTNITHLGSVSYRSGNAPRVTPIFDPFIGVSVHARIDSQRRRLGTEVT